MRRPTSSRIRYRPGMCGHHCESGFDSYAPDEPAVTRPVGRTGRRLHRRVFLGQFGSATSLALLGPVGLVACGSDAGPAQRTLTTANGGGVSSEPATTPATGRAPSAEAGDPGRWGRVDLGFVSAYVLVRNNRAAIVDTGVEGSLDAIGRTLADLGLTFDDVDHVVLTHHHRDHAGSIGAVLAAASGAVAHAGAADVGRIPQVDLSPVDDGAEIFGMQVIHTPGHTPGHVSLLDPMTGVLVAGDALNGVDGGVGAADPNFSLDMATADASVRKLAQLEFDTVYFGHGDPILGDARQAVADLAARL